MIEVFLLSTAHISSMCNLYSLPMRLPMKPWWGKPGGRAEHIHSVMVQGQGAQHGFWPSGILYIYIF